MKKILNCLKLVLIFPLFFTTLIFADESVDLDDDLNVSANINVDNFSNVDVSPNTIEAGIASDVTVILLDYMGSPVSGHSIRIYVEGDDTGVALVQPSDTDSLGRAVGSIFSTQVGSYKVRAVDNTYGYDILITDFDFLYTTPLDTPSLQQEPQYTRGDSNTLSWATESGYEYFLETSKTSTFDTIEYDTGWISASQYTFTNLQNEQIYYYRLKKRNTGNGQSAWSDIVYSVQDNENPEIQLLSVENMDSTPNTADDYVEIKAQITDNISLESQSTYCVRVSGSLYECASYTNLSGSIYTAKIPIDQLEKDNNGLLLDRYDFCIEARDEAGNISRNCNIELVIREEKVPVQADIVDSEDNVFRFGDINLKTLSYLPYTIVDSMVSTMTDLQVSLTSLLIAILIFILLLTSYLKDFFTALRYPIYLFISIFQKHREYKLDGVVYDSYSKNPLRFSFVKALNDDGYVMDWAVTNEDGEFHMELEDNKVEVVVFKNGFLFPSTLVTEKTDYPMINVYTGGRVNFRSSKHLEISIPLDIVKRSLISQMLGKGFRALLNTFLSMLLVFSIFLSTFLLTDGFTAINFLILCFNVLDVVLIIGLLIRRRKPFLVKNVEGKLVEGITVVVKDSKSGKIKEKRVSNYRGEYYFNLDRGEYVLDILNKDFNLIKVEGGSEFSIKRREDNYWGRDLIVEDK